MRPFTLSHSIQADVELPSIAGAGLQEWLKRPPVRVLGHGWHIIFSRNLAPDFTHYLSERQKMISQDESSRKANTTRKKNKMAERKANKTIKARDLKPAKEDPQLSERIGAARDPACFDGPLPLQLNIVPGLNFFWD